MQSAVAPLADKMKYNRAVVVHLGFARRARSGAVGVLVPTIEHSQIGLLWLEHNKLEGAAPAGHSLFSCYFEEGGLDTIQPPSDEHFIEVAQKFVTKLFPEVDGAPDMTNVTRWEVAIPRTAPGVYKAIHETKSRLDPASRIQLAGDYLTCTGQNSAIFWGQSAADSIVKHAQAARP
jgi:protoporphyrinogen oxidase